jgi:Uma2 family endonuclease
MIIMELGIDLGLRYTYADFLTWIDSKRRELIDGFVKLMASPRAIHQDVSGNIYIALRGLVRRAGGVCRVYEDMDVCLVAGAATPVSEIRTVLRPDVCVICDLSKLVDGICKGSPELVIEIQSPGTAHYDMHRKFELYERYGVLEYWIVQPVECWVRVFTLIDGHYDDGVLYESGRIPISIFSGLSIDLRKLFREQSL